ncbi:MAG: hypothetical protein LWW90_02145 [Candidatus Desulfofervidus auxilii]|nr:hypothetical protein [Candidatus Desulfofervidus auxilii]
MDEKNILREVKVRPIRKKAFSLWKTILLCRIPVWDIQVASQFGKVYGIIGDLHGTRPEALRNLRLICATHCTQYKSEINSLYLEKYIEGGAGKNN